MRVAKSQLMVLFMSFTGLAVVARTGPVVDLLLILMSGFMALSLLYGPNLPKRMRAVLPAFTIFFLVYLVLTVLKPSQTGIVNIIGVVISAVVFFYFVVFAQRLIEARHSGNILFACGVSITVIGTVLNLVSKNTISGIACYFFLAAGVVWVAQGMSLWRATTRTALVLIVLLGIIIEHRMMLGAGLCVLLVTLIIRYAPLAIMRNVLLAGGIACIVMMVALFGGLWGLDIQDFDAYFIEYTGRTARSGRQIIWPLIIAFTAESPWIGLSTGMTFSKLYDSHWSAHSYFLQVYMQTGAIGLISVGLLLVSTWSAIGRPSRSKPVRTVATAGFVVLLLHSTFEVFLTQVNLLMGCAAWMMLGLSVGASKAVETVEFARRTAPRTFASGIGEPMISKL